MRNGDIMKIQYNKYIQYFSNSKFWEKIKKVSKTLGVKTVCYALTLFYILQKKEVPSKDKALILGCLGYFIFPFDFIPDILPAGYSDDIIAMLFTIRRCMKYIDDDIKYKVKLKLKSWFKLSDSYLEQLFKKIN